MVSTKTILISITAIFVLGSAGIWFFVSEWRAPEERHQEFFGTSKQYPTSGGQKMKPEW